jgi:hypothetical protein
MQSEAAQLCIVYNARSITFGSPLMHGVSIAYLLLAASGLSVPWFFNLRFLRQGTIWDFLAATCVNDAACSISADVLIAAIAGCIWVVNEAKRLRMPYPWLWVLLTFSVAFAFAFPLFLFVRERRLRGSFAPQD